ncbi:MAG: hypothetical protein M1497_12970 [Nitrospirae bacterium]|nr:hypothetical protein [Nitrospirota bacterium]
MMRIVTQVLIGLMLLFGAVNLAPRVAFHFRSGNGLRSLLFLVLALVSLFFSVMAFYFAYVGIREP